ncbi:MAG: hypothetical protein AB8H80_21165, partial [Planctomycetota bacterium]
SPPQQESNMEFGDFLRHVSLVFASYLGLLGIPAPLPVPPMPEDSALLRVAPADSMLFVEWFGAGPANDDPTNRTERLAAEPEVHAAILKLVESGREMVSHQTRGVPNQEQPLEIYDHVLTLMQKPGCAFVRSMTPFQGGLVVHAGNDAHKVLRTINTVLQDTLSDGAPRSKKTIDGVEFDTIALSKGMEFVGWAAIEGYFVVSVGDAAARQAIAGIGNKDPGLRGKAGLTKLLEGTKVERPMLRTFAAVDQIVEELPWTKKFWEPLGLSNVTAALSESGLEGDGFVARTQLSVAKPTGLFGNLRGRPLSVDDLALIPGDATTALAMRCKEGSLEQTGLLLASSLAGEDPTPAWERTLDRFRAQFQIDLSTGLIAQLDDCAAAWNSPSQGGLGFTAAAASLPLKDASAFGENLTSMWRSLEDVAPNKERKLEQGGRIRSFGGYLDTFTYRGIKAWWIDHIHRDFPFGLSLTNTDRHGLMAIQPQALRSAIDASMAPNFDKALVREPVVARRGNATAMLYLNLKGVLNQGYGALLPTFQMASHEMHNEGFGFDLSDIPRLATLAPHLGPELVVLEPIEAGYRMTRRGTLPVLDSLLVSAGAACLITIN